MIQARPSPAQVRQDEGGPKLLNDYSPADSQFGGGLGYLVDATSGELLLTTRYAGAAAAPQQHYAREFGVGYARRRLSQRRSPAGDPEGLVAEQRLVVPFGWPSSLPPSVGRSTRST
jgi:hypothetical protein